MKPLIGLAYRPSRDGGFEGIVYIWEPTERAARDADAAISRVANRLDMDTSYGKGGGRGYTIGGSFTHETKRTIAAMEKLATATCFIDDPSASNEDLWIGLASMRTDAEQMAAAGAGAKRRENERRVAAYDARRPCRGR